MSDLSSYINIAANSITGNLSLPEGGVIYSEGFTPSGNPGNTIILQPAGAGVTTNQQLLVYPTAGDGDHIHMTSGNLYETELFLGSDGLFVKLANTGNIVINSNDDNGNIGTWTFGTNDSLTLPKNSIINEVTPVTGAAASIIVQQGSSSIANGLFVSLPPATVTNYTVPGTDIIVTVTWVANGPSYYAPRFTVVNGGTGHTGGGEFGGGEVLTVPYVDMGITGGGNWTWYVGDIASNLILEAGLNSWTFGGNGNLTLPAGGTLIVSGGIVSNGASPAPTLSGFSSVSALTLSASGNITSNNISTGTITLTNGAVIKDTTNEAVSFGQGAGANTQGNSAVAIGLNAGQTGQGISSVAIGYGAGFTDQGNQSVAIGENAGANQGSTAVAIGQNAGGGVAYQNDDAVAIGHSAGEEDQGTQAIAIGLYAGQVAQGLNSIALGAYAGQTGQGNEAVAIGDTAGQTEQGISSVAIGYGTGSYQQGNSAVAIGWAAATQYQGANAVAIGAYAGESNQGNNSIIINATGNTLDQTTANTFTVAPVRNDTSNIAEVMFYNTTSKEVTYGNTINVAGDITANVANLYAINISQGITWSGNSSVYEDTSLVLQGEISVGITSPNTTQITANTSTWSFDNTGNLTLPGNLIIAGNTNVFGTDAALIQSTDDKPLIALSSGANGAIATSWVEDIGNIGTSNIAAVYANPIPGSKIIRIAVGENGGPGPNLWDFNANGNTTFPGDLIGNGASPAPSISGFDSANFVGNVTGAYFIGNGSQLTDVGVASVPSQNILPTIQSITISATSNGGTGGGSGWANVTVANTIPVTEYGVIVTAGTISQKYVTGSLGSIPGTVQLNITTGLNTTPFTVYAYVTSNAGTYYSNSATGTSGICLLAGTQIALSDGSYKAIEDITYTDKMLSWDFDRGCYAETLALWIKRGETGSQYNLLTFSDGTTLRTFDQHRIFNKQAGAFTYPMTDATPIGTITVNEHGKEITLTNKQMIVDTIEYYNVITDYHMNLFSDNVLTSCRFNNIYPIIDMKFVKDARTLRTRDEFENVEDRFFNGLRLAEQTTDIETVEWYVNRLISTEVLTQSELTV